MSKQLSRREFMAVTSASGVGLALAGANAFGQDAAGFKTRLHTALISGLPNEKQLASLKEVGIEGLECDQWNAEPAAAEQARQRAEKAGMKIHSVLRGWTQFNDATVVDQHIETVKTALKTSQLLGADALLLVPCRIDGKGAPQPWEFDIEFDEKNGHIRRVAPGDNTPYQAYIKAHNQAADASREALYKLISTAEKTGVVIAVENVWNNLWVKPDFFAHFVKSFKSRWIQTYYDIGNHVKYAPPEEWIGALGSTIAKCHIKDFKLNENGQGGTFVNIREGSVNWPSVRRALDRVGYNGWMTLEGSGELSLEEKAKRMDLILAGK